MKNLKNLGKTLNKNEQKQVNGGGGRGYICDPDDFVVCYFPEVCELGANGWTCVPGTC